MSEFNQNIKTLNQLNTSESGIIVKVKGHGSFRKRIIEMGFVKGKKVTVLKKAPLQDPVEYKILDYNISLRESETKLIEIYPCSNDFEINPQAFEGTTVHTSENNLLIKEKLKTVQVAFVGNPNCGKTSLYNFASGSHEHVGNYSGVTIEARHAHFKKSGYTFNIVDLPGTYSLTEFSPEELYVRRHLTKEHPDIVVNVIDASNIERNLYLTTQLIDMNIKVVIALNMFDELENKKVNFNYEALSQMIGIPIVPTVAIKGKGIPQLFDKIIDVYEDKEKTLRHIHINYGIDIESSIKKLQTLIQKNKSITDIYSSRYLSIKTLDKDKSIREELNICSNYNEIIELADKEIQFLEKQWIEDTETLISQAKYGFIAGALNETYKQIAPTLKNHSTRIDGILTHKWFGFPLFVLFMWIMFQTTFSLGSFPMEWIDNGVHAFSSFASSFLPSGLWHDLIIDGLIGGIGGVIIFLPNILILFFFISFMEDTGYMARASFIMDKLMHSIGLHGKSFIPMLMGFGCNVPAVMATRTLENKKDRLITMLIIPFMSCSARLPVYVLLISAFFPANQGLVLISIYIIGVILSALMAWVFNHTLFKKHEAPFVMELPPYRIPTIRNTVRHMWFKAVQYLKKMGSVILIASLIIWAMSYFPRNAHFTEQFNPLIEKIENSNHINEISKSHLLENINSVQKSQQLENSLIGKMGKTIEPLIAPLGFDWKIGISIITGMAAKEIVVSTMAVVYQNTDNSEKTLTQRLQEQVYNSGPNFGKPVFTPWVAYALMIFVLIYFPCVAVIAAIKKESTGKWALFTAVYTTGLAWIFAFLVYNLQYLY